MKTLEDNKLKSYNTQKKKIKNDLVLLKSEKTNLNKEIELKEKRLTEINNSIKKLTNDNIIVSEHAVLRYLERVEGINISEIKEKILNNDLINMYKTLGNGTYPINRSNNNKAIIKNNIVITIIN